MPEIEFRDDTIYFKQTGDIVLSLKEEAQADQLTIFLVGSVLYDFASFVEEELLLASYGFNHIILDLAKTQSLCASCYDDFLDLQKKMESKKNAEFYLRHTPKSILEEISQIGYNYILDIREE